MSTINIFHKKLSFSILAILSLLLIVSISFGTVNSSKSATGSREKSEVKSSLVDLQNRPAVKIVAETRELGFLANIIKTLFNGSVIEQPAKGDAANLSSSASSPDSIFVVNNVGDTNDAALANGVCADASGNCTLRAAIQQANATAGADEITFNLTTPAVIQLSLSGGLLISEVVTITGPGARLLTVRGNSGTSAGIFKINYAGTTPTIISGLTAADSEGHGINNEARLNLTDVTVKGNYFGIYNTGRLNLNRVLINNNSSGGIYIGSSSIVNISNTTITSNASSGHGGGIHSLSPDVTLNNVTISNNTAFTSGGGIYYSGQTAGIYVRNTIIAGNTAPATAGPDIFSFNNLNGAVFTSRGNNLIGKSGAGTGFVHGVNSDMVGTVAAPINPLLGPLQNNGGQLDTKALFIGSPARDAGNICVVSLGCGQNNPTDFLTTDLRGANFPRYFEAGVDIGAFESFFPVPSISSLNPPNWGTGRGAFELVVNGGNFVAESVVKWNGQNKVTTFVSNTQIKAQILASDVTAAGQYPVTVANPQPSAAPSDPTNFTVVDCSFVLTPTSQNFPAAGGSGSVTVTTPNGCTWSPTSTTPSWLTITALNPTNGKGPGTFSFAVAANPGADRTGTIILNGITFTVTQNSGCAYTLSPSNFTAPVGGGNGSVNITANSGCAWTAQSSVSWITVSNTTGTGSGTVNFSVAPNTGQSRTGTITIGGQPFTVNQGSGCVYSLLPTSANPPSGGGTDIFSISAGAGCAWTAVSNATWITVAAGSASGTGNATITFSIAANTGSSRTGTITAGGQIFTVNQPAGCTYSISSISASSPASGLAGSVNVTANTGCAWTAVSNTSWITVTSGSPGSGNGTVQFTVAANTGPERTGTITIAGQSFAVTQANGCVYTLPSTGANAVAGGGTGSFSVNAGAGCTWTAVSNATWITVTGGSPGSGNGTVQFTVAANIGPERIGTITAGGQTFTVTQANGCAFTINPTSQSFATAAAGTGSFAITASNSGCVWNATTNAPSWITITNATGTGNGTIGFSVAANTGPARSGTISVGGQTFTINQVSGCIFTLSSNGTNFPNTGGSGSFNVTTNNGGCSWTAVTTDSWITINNGTGTGTGVVSFTVAANITPVRTGTITVGGQTFTITQDNGCVYTLSATSATPSAAGGTSSFNINAGAGCTWTAVSNVPWITITNPNGTGSGVINYTVAANTGPIREGTITAGGKTFTVTQASGCNYSISPTSANSPATGSTGSVSVTSIVGCGWTAVSNASWITVTSGSPGSGNGTVQFTVAANTGPERTGTITIAGQSFAVTQANGCVYTLPSTGANAVAGGGTGSFSVNAGAGCTWTAVSNATWITVTGGSPGSGNGTVQFTVAANIGPERIGTITAGGQTFTVTQANGCAFTINPTSQNFTTAAAGTGSFAITASNSGCVWNATTNAPSWITITNATGTGNGTIGFSVAANTGPARSGTISVGGQTFTINQASGCTFTLTPTSANFEPIGGSGSFNVTTNNGGCSWTAVTTDSWITINNGTGTGTGVVSFTVAANITPVRTGTITVGGQTFTVNQSNGCVYTLSPTGANVPSGSSTNSFNINSGAGCTWTAVSDVTWITITNPNGTGSGVINYTVAATVGPERTGMITVGGKTFKVTQANGCVYTLSPTSTISPIAGLTTGSVNVTAINGCGWTAVSNNSWITVTGGSPGSGNGTVQYTVAANTGPARQGTITIAGQTFTVTQANGCVYALSSTSASISESGGIANFVINSGAGCTWTAVSDVPWITITSGAVGSGFGTVEYSVLSNIGGADRDGTITTANGQTVTVRQVSLTVRNFNDSGFGSLRQSVINANNSPGNDVITFQLPNPGIIKLTSGEITIINNGTLEIRGPGNEFLHISGENTSRIFYINGANVTISGVSLTKGNGVGTDSVSNYKFGGAVYVKQGALALNRVHLFFNTISVPNTPESRSFGGGVYYFGGSSHQIKNSTFSSNKSLYGAGYSSQGNVTIENSTFSLNVAEKAGGAIYSVGDTILRNVTITNNSSDGTNASGAGIISEGGRINPVNTIIAGNNGPEITFTAGQFLDGGNNLIGDAPGDSANTNRPLVYHSSDILDTPPMLSPLNLYGGTISTEALLVNSPAIDAGSNAGAPSMQTDQRGSPRVMNGTIDIGAFEYNIRISPFPSVLPSSDINVYYSQLLVANRIDGTDPFEPFKFFIIGAFLPPGLQLSQEGHIYGIPTTAGVYTFIVKAIAPNEMAGVNKYTISVGCSYSINPSNQSVSSTGENGTVNLTTSAGCQWTANSNAPWITVTNNTGNPRVDSGAVAFSVQPNTGNARSGTITIGGQIFTVNQANGCAYTLSSTSASSPAGGSAGNFSVNSGTGCAWSAASNASWITIINGNAATGNAAVNFTTQANTGAARTGTMTAAGQTFTVNQSAAGPVASRRSQFDFDGDNKTDLSIFRPSLGEWWYLKSSSGGNGAVQFGSSTDKIVPADYTGDGKTDIAFFRPSSGEWFVLRSEDFSFYSFPFGTNGDIPAPADYDGDGKSDPAIFRPSTQTWYIFRSSGGTTIQQFGVAGDVPVVADYDGDNKADLAIYRPSKGEWWLERSTAGSIAFQFGASTDKPVQGDYTGDGKTDTAFFRPSTNEWFVLRSENNSFYSFPFGAAGDVPSPGDYDGDGKFDAAVFRPSTVTWFVQQTSSGTSIQTFGASGDLSVPNAFVP